MKRKVFLAILHAVLIISSRSDANMNVPDTVINVQLPARYFQLLEAGIPRIEKRLADEPGATLATLESVDGWKHFPCAILAPAVLYAKKHKANTHYGDKRMLALAQRMGDLLVTENEKGTYTPRHDSDWDTYLWLEAYRILETALSEEQRNSWKKAILENVALLEPKLAKCLDYPWYTAPFIITSPNHYAIYASTMLVAARVFNKPDWEEMASRVLHRFVTEEQSIDGYWGEQSQLGPTTGYDYLTETQIALYWEYTKDPMALEALRKSTDFHKYYTYPDGTPVETINDRNRYWEVPRWGHFGFSNFPDGRRFAAFITGNLPADGGDMQSLGRIAQNALYYHEGKSAPIPQDQSRYAHAMKITAGIRKTGPWVVTYSGLMTPKSVLNNFFLDRQSNISVFNEQKGLIISGANSKWQPELATFNETIGTHLSNMPLNSRLQMSDTMDRLGVAYDVFFATLEVPPPSEHQLKLTVRTNYKWGEATANLTLQLMLKPGQTLETGSGKTIVLGRDSITLNSKDLGGWIHHNGWKLQLPADAILKWPVFPYNPYTSGPEVDLARAIGTITIPFWSGMKERAGQEFPFVLEVDKNE
ncbi:MAG: hypothetical protein JNK79_08940 [Chitinophagaceae bacterium]|nr:hypothetical protein [Chitinophagaceae bacterium]